MILPALSFAQFNILEGVFWCFCGALALYAFRKGVFLPKGFWLILSVDFILFGVSDFVEASYPVSFLESGGEWLLWWKAFCIALFIGLLTFYIQRRLKLRS